VNPNLTNPKRRYRWVGWAMGSPRHVATLLTRGAPLWRVSSSCKKINRSHTHTQRTTPPTHTHTRQETTHPKRPTNPQTNTPHKPLTTLEGRPRVNVNKKLNLVSKCATVPLCAVSCRACVAMEEATALMPGVPPGLTRINPFPDIL